MNLDTTGVDISTRDGVMLKLRWQGKGPRVLFCHGTGLACDAFAPFISRLAESFEVFYFDLRGHGLSEKPPAEHFSLFAMRLDFVDIVKAINERFGAKPLVGVFHSISSVLALCAVADEPALFTSIICYEPPLMHADKANAVSPEEGNSMAAGARRRRNDFATVADLQQRFGRRSAGAMSDSAAEILAGALLYQRADGRYQLRCAPEFEARVYEQNSHFNLWQTMPNIEVPVALVAGRRTGVEDYTACIAPEVADCGNFDLLKFNGLGHLAWIEEPEFSADICAFYITHGTHSH